MSEEQTVENQAQAAPVPVSIKRGVTVCSTMGVNLNDHLRQFLYTNPFFAQVSRHITKVPTLDIPTAGVGYDRNDERLKLFWNPKFFKLLSDEEIQGILYHEVYHVVLKHISRKYSSLRNIAQDLTINSMIETINDSTISMPRFACIPGQRGEILDHKTGERTPITDEMMENDPRCKLAKFIYNVEPGYTSQEYYELLKQQGFEENKQLGDYEYTFDEHAGSESLPGVTDIDELDGYAQAKLDGLVSKATRDAMESNNWGNTPENVKGSLILRLSKTVSWRSILQMFIGYAQPAGSSKTIKRINKRYPYIHPGNKKNIRPRFLIAVDESGSVDDGMLSLFFNALSGLSSDVEFDLIPFDCALDEEDLYTWKVNTTPTFERIRMGGTDFNVPTRFVNLPENKGRWDALIICTDGEAPAPEHCSIRRGWALTKGARMMFDTDETKIFVDEDVVSPEI